MRPVSLKRQREWRERPVNTDERICQLCGLLDELEPQGWDEHKRAWAGHPEAGIIDRHHVFGRKFGAFEAEWNVVLVCRVAHEFVQGTPVGRLVCVLVQEERRLFPRDAIFAATGRDQAGVIANDLENGLFSWKCEDAAVAFCQRWGV